MSSKPQIKIRSIFSRINKSMKDAADPLNILPTAQFTIDLIVKRARLGYGVDHDEGDKFTFPSLSANYRAFRARYSGLSGTTSPNKSNITLTGQLLDSIDVIRKKDGEIVIGPTGTRSGSSLTNKKLAGYLADQGRPFMFVSRLEYQQILRFYRKTFGDLLGKQGLLR